MKKVKEIYGKTKEFVFCHQGGIKAVSIFILQLAVLGMSFMFPEVASAQAQLPGIAQGQNLVTIAEEYGGPIVGGLGIFMMGVEHMTGKGEGKLLKHIGSIGTGAAFIGGGETLYSYFANGHL